MNGLPAAFPGALFMKITKTMFFSGLIKVVKLLQGDAEVTKWARLQVNAAEESDVLDGEECLRSSLRSHLNLALLDVEDDSLSLSSIEHSISLEDYLQGRRSRRSSLD